MFERYQTIHLHLQGMTMKQIAGIIKRSEKTVSSIFAPIKIMASMG
ncbi:hypothetical protein [Paenibacillus sp. MZ04-78.2]